MSTTETHMPPDSGLQLRPWRRQKVKPLSVAHWEWIFGQKMIARIPAVRRYLPLYDRVASAYEGAEVHGFTEQVDIPHAELCRSFKAQSTFDLDVSVTRRVNLLILRDKTVLGTTGRIIDERKEALLRFLGERDYVARNDFLIRRHRPVEKPDGMYFNMLGADRGHAHLYHFVFERLKYLYYLIERLDRPQGDIHLLVRPRLPEYQRKVLDVVREEHPWLHFTPVPPQERWRLGSLCHVDVAQNATHAWTDPRFLDFVRRTWMRAYDVDPEPKARRRIFISREDTKLRRFTNAPELHAVLERHGFETVLAARLSFREQIETFRDAAVIAATHGAGLTNIVFAPADTPVIEFYPATKMYPAYLELALSRNRPYHWLRGGPGGKFERFHLDPDELDAALERLLPAGGGSG